MYGGSITFPYSAASVVVPAFSSTCASAPRHLTLHLLVTHVDAAIASDGGASPLHFSGPGSPVSPLSSAAAGAGASSAPLHHASAKALVVVVLLVGSRDDGDRLLSHLLDCATPLSVNLVEAPLYRLVDVNNHTVRRPRRLARAALGHHWRALQFNDTGSERGEVDVGTLQSACDGMPDGCMLLIEQLGGAYRDGDSSSSSVSFRSCPFLLYIMGRFDAGSPEARSAAVSWVKAATNAFSLFTNRPLCNGNSGVDTPEAVWGALAPTLRACKRKFDPENFWRRNTNIPPTL